MTYVTYVVLDKDKPGRWPSPFCSFLYQPVYVGKGVPSRAEHVNQVFRIKKAKPHSGKLFHGWLIGKKNSGATEVPLVILNAQNEVHAFAQEQILTDHFGLKLAGGLLLNVRRGGQDGWSLSESTKKLISEANMGSKNPNWGKQWTEERRAKWYATWNSKTRTRSPETMEKAWASVRRKYLITNLSGEQFQCADLTAFCVANKLPLSSFRKALKTDGTVRSKKRPSIVEDWKIAYCS